MSTGKTLNIVQKLNKNDIIECLKNNGFDEFEEIFIQKEITDGYKFLGLTELDLLKWKLEPAARKKLWSFLMQLQKNPERYLQLPEAKRTTSLSRRQSIFHNKNDFKAKLEQVILPKSEVQIEQKPVLPKKPQIKKLELSEDEKEDRSPKEKLNTLIQIKKKPLPPPPQEVVSYKEESFYLNTEVKKTKPQKENQNFENFYDENGYLLPSKSQDSDIDVVYESPPTISERPPQTLPRKKSAEQYYLLRPKDDEITEPPPLLPRTRKTSEAVSQDSVTEEETDEIEDTQSVSSLKINESGTLSKFFTFFKGNKKISNLEQSGSKSDNLSSLKEKPESDNKSLNNSREKLSPTTKSIRRELAVQDRPLPPLPPIHDSIDQSETSKNHRTKNLSLFIQSDTNLLAQAQLPKKSKSENNLLDSQNEDNVTYGNVEEEKPKFPKSYELFSIESGSSKLPLPPNTLPTFPLDPSVIDVAASEDEETEEYGNYIFNINDEPFYRNTDRKGAKQLLQDLEDGAFLFRPSENYYLTLSLKYENKYFNLGIDKGENNRIRLNTEDENLSPEFATLKEFVEHFTKEYLTFQHKDRILRVHLKPALTADRF